MALERIGCRVEGDPWDRRAPSRIVQFPGEFFGKIVIELRSGSLSAGELRKSTGISQITDFLAILESLGYIRNVSEHYDLVVPVLTIEDGPMVQNIIQKSRAMLTEWLNKNFALLKAELKDLSAYKYGQPFEATFYKIWHELFGAANRILVEKRMFCDPYAEDRKYKGFVPFVWNMRVLAEK